MSNILILHYSFQTGHSCSENNQGMPNTSAVTRGHDIDVKPCTCVSRDQSIEKKYPACTDEQVPLPTEVTPTMYWKVVPSSDRDLDGNNSYRQQVVAPVNQPLSINLPSSEGDFCGQVKPKVRYVYNCLLDMFIVDTERPF